MDEKLKAIEGYIKENHLSVKTLIASIAGGYFILTSNPIAGIVIGVGTFIGLSRIKQS